MKTLPVISIIIAAIVAIAELSYIGKTSLAWVILGLAVSVVLLAIYVLSGKER